jgi:hypothetical protein
MAGRHYGQDAATTHPFELEVRRRQREQKRGKRFRGGIDAATQDFLQSMEAHTPPYLDEYEQAKARTDDWLAVGWVAPEEIVRWRHACPGVWPETAIALANIGVSPRLAATASATARSTQTLRRCGRVCRTGR